MVKRKIVEIDEKKCNGCGLCIPNCHEGALQIIGGKARLVKDIYCDGLGNCLGHCPQNAIHIVEKNVPAFDFEMTNLHLEKLGRKKLGANPLEGRKAPYSCPGAAIREFKHKGATIGEQPSALGQWPVQLALLPAEAPFFKDSSLLVCADCVPFACANFHQKLLERKSLVIGCPKLDDIGSYQEKLTEIFNANRIRDITVAIMEVPCCHGLYAAVERALADSKKKIPLEKRIVSVSGGWGKRYK